jgi:hypothetical protein
MSPENVPSSPGDTKVGIIAQAVKVHQEKGALFRVVHADGVWCSVNAYSNIHLSFFSERAPIPKAVYMGIDEKGVVVREMVEKREVKEGWFRELEVDVVLSIGAAKAVEQSLRDYIALAEKQIKSFEEAKQK